MTDGDVRTVRVEHLADGLGIGTATPRPSWTVETPTEGWRQSAYEVYLGGQQVGDHVLAPGWTSYDHRLRYQTFDVTPLLPAGRHILGAMLGDGWYRGRLGFGGGRRNIYGDRLGLLAQLEIEYAD